MEPQTLTNLSLQYIYESFLQNEIKKQAFHKAEKSRCNMKASESYFFLYVSVTNCHLKWKQMLLPLECTCCSYKERIVVHSYEIETKG